jgi:hypothetical protein
VRFGLKLELFVLESILENKSTQINSLNWYLVFAIAIAITIANNTDNSFIFCLFDCLKLAYLAKYSSKELFYII